MVDKVPVIYIHGFASGKNSSTYRKILEKYPNAIALEYDSALPYKENIKSLLRQFPECSEVVIIGTSLGGYYAMQVAMQYRAYCKCILINPCVNPKESLLKYVGKQVNFQTNQYFDFTLETTQSYEALDMAKYAGRPTSVFLAKDDEVLDYKLAENLLKPYTRIEYISGGHRLKDYEKLFIEIEEMKNILII